MQIDKYSQKINDYLFIFFAFLLPLSRASDTLFTIYFSIYFIIYIIKNYHNSPILRERFFIFSLIFIIYVLISISWNNLDNKRLGDSTHYVQWIALFGVAAYIMKNKEVIDKAITAFLGGMLISETLSYGIYFGFWKINGKGVDDPTPFMMHIDYSVYIAIGALILLNRIFSSRYSLKQKIFMGIYFITMSGNLFINGGRTGQIAFIIAMVIAFFLHFKITLKNFLIIFGLIFTIVTTAFYSSSNFHDRAVLAVEDIKKISIDNNYSSSWGVRIAIWRITPMVIKDNLIFGSGINSQTTEYKKLFDNVDIPYITKEKKEFIYTHHLHSQYLQTVVELGIVGILLQIYLFYLIFKFNIKVKEFKELKNIFLVIFIFSNFPEPLFLKQFTNILYIFFVGILFGLHINNRAKE